MPNWKRTLYILWVVQFMTTVAMTLGLTFVPFFLEQDPALNVKDESRKLLFTSLILAGPFFTAIIATPFWGWMADRSGRKQQVIRAALGLAATQLLMGVAQSPEQLVALRVLQGLVSGVIAANLGLLSASTPTEHQGYAISTLQSSNPAGLIVGPILGGFLATAFGFRAVYFILGGIVLAMGLLAWVLIREESFTPTASPNPFRGIYAALGKAWQLPRLRLAFGTLFIGQLAWTIGQVVFAIYAGKLINDYVATHEVTRSFWNRDVGFTAICQTLAGLTNFLMSQYWGRAFDRGTPYLTARGAGLLSLGTLALAFWPPFWGVMLARISVGAGQGGVQALQYASISGNVPQDERGQFMGLATATQHVGNLVGFVGGGALAQVWSESGNFVLTAGLYLSIAVLALVYDRRREPA